MSSIKIKWLRLMSPISNSSQCPFNWLWVSILRSHKHGEITRKSDKNHRIWDDKKCKHNRHRRLFRPKLSILLIYKTQTISYRRKYLICNESRTNGLVMIHYITNSMSLDIFRILVWWILLWHLKNVCNISPIDCSANHFERTHTSGMKVERKCFSHRIRFHSSCSR